MSCERWRGAAEGPQPRREHWTAREVQALEAELAQALTICTAARGRLLSRSQARRIALRIAALERALDELTEA